MKITTKGIILAVKNIGGWLASYNISGIKADTTQFILSLTTFMMLTTLSDLYLLNRWVNAKTEKIPDQT